ncbi:DUF3342-containing protein [Aureococcus anophagefferens]|nr:DUF3342-containing protein [Aureococcus anophagefferens]
MVTTAPAAAAPVNVAQSELIIIHVCDEARQINRDFACDRSVLLEEMKYFQSYLGGDSGSFDDIDISVHCDVHIFEWLVQWIHSPLRPPPLDSSSVVSILISSEFLEMERLVEHCLRHMPIDLACVSEKLVLRLAELCTAEVLASLSDKKDKLLPKLYKRRLEIDFRHRHAEARKDRDAKEPDKKPGAKRDGDEKKDGDLRAPASGGPSEKPVSREILRCRHCAKLCPAWAQKWLPCADAPFLVDGRGALASRHAPVLERWSLTEHVGALHALGMTWEEVHWLMWGVTHVFRCSACAKWFGADDLGRCLYHEERPHFADDFRMHGAYGCCGAPCLRFSAYADVAGCRCREHRIDPRRGSAKPSTLRLLQRQGKLIAHAAKRAGLRSPGPTGEPASSANSGAENASECASSSDAVSNGSGGKKGDESSKKDAAKGDEANAESQASGDEGGVQAGSQADAGSRAGSAEKNDSDKEAKPSDKPKKSNAKSADAKKPGARPPTDKKKKAQDDDEPADRGRRASAQSKRAGKAVKAKDGKATLTSQDLKQLNLPASAAPPASAKEGSEKGSDAGDAPAAKPAAQARPMRSPHHSVFAATPDSAAAGDDEVHLRDHKHPLAKPLPESQREARERRESAALSPRRKRAWDMECIWREKDVARMRHLSEYLAAMRTPYAADLAKSGDAGGGDDRKGKRAAEAEKRRWR